MKDTKELKTHYVIGKVDSEGEMVSYASNVCCPIPCTKEESLAFYKYVQSRSTGYKLYEVTFKDISPEGEPK